MKKSNKLFLFLLGFLLISCNNQQVEKNIEMYSHTWDEVLNNGKLELINDKNFDKDITLISSPENVVGIENFKAYYSNFTAGFSNIEFTLVDVFGQGDKLVKHWKFKGTHSGDFFGISATGKLVDVEGTTLVKMKNGKISQEQDFMDNMVFMQQLGMLSKPENTNIIKNLYDNFATGNIEGLAAAMDANIVWNEAENFPFADGNPYIGFDAIGSGVFSRIEAEWEYWNLADLDYNELTNDKILVTGRYKAKYKKNGAIINLQMAHLWTLNDGKIIAFQQYADTKGIADAIK